MTRSHHGKQTKMNLPGFLFVGAPKCGTASLFEILDQHPDIFLAMVKEVHFFDDDRRYERGLAWYSEQFRGRKREQAVGEITPEYMFYDHVPKRIYDDLGSEVKLIFIFRNPVDRAYSEYLHNHRKGMLDVDSFEEALQLEFRSPELPFFEKRYFSFISKGLYAKYVERFLEYFPRENLLFLVFEEDFVADRQETINRIQDFVGVRRFALDLDVRRNKTVIPKYKAIYRFVYSAGFRRWVRRMIPFAKLRKRTKWLLNELLRSRQDAPPVSGALRQEMLERYFLADIHKLEMILNRDLSLWYKPSPERTRLSSDRVAGSTV